MPVNQITENATNIASNSSVIQILKDWTSVIFPVLGAIGAVFTWAWNRMQRGVDNLEIALTAHATANEKLFDSLFTEQREMAEKLNELHGAHEVIHNAANQPSFRSWAVNNEFTGKRLEQNTGVERG